MSAAAGLLDPQAAGGLAGTRLALALALSLGVHAGAALWLEVPGGAPRPAPESRAIEARLSGAAPRVTLAPVPPAVPRDTVPATAVPVRTAAAQSMLAPARQARAAPLAPAQRPVRQARPRPRAGTAQPAPLAASAVPEAAPAPASRVVAGAAREAPALRAAADAVHETAPRPLRRAAGEHRTPQLAVAAGEVPAARRLAAARAVPRPVRPPAAAGAPALRNVLLPPRPRADNPRPEYPLLARRRGQQGRVVLRLEVSPQGVPTAVRVQRSSGVASLDRAARETVSRWRFVPARSAGRPQAATVEVPVEFRLAGR